MIFMWQLLKYKNVFIILRLLLPSCFPIQHGYNSSRRRLLLVAMTFFNPRNTIRKLAKMRVLITGIAALYLDDVLIKFETIITCCSVDFHQTVEMWN